MRITKNSSSNLYIAHIMSKINKNQKFTFNNQNDSGNKKGKMQKSFLLEKKESLINEEPIKVQLLKNNQNKKEYSNKTIDYKSLYNKGLTTKTSTNSNNNISINLPQKSSNNIEIQKYKVEAKLNDDNIKDIKTYNDINNSNNKYNDLGNIDRLKKYLIPRNNLNRNSTKMNRPKVISASPIAKNPYLQKGEEGGEENLKQNNNDQQNHKMRDLLSQKFLYNKPKTTSTPNNIKKNSHGYELKTFNNKINNYNNNDNISVTSFNYNKNINDNLSVVSFEGAYSVFNSHNNSNFNFKPEIKLDDLIIYDERLNDILVALNNNKNYEPDASNECAEFFVFYFHSTLQKIFPIFFNSKNKIIIDSANNLTLLSIMITYHLSLIKDILKDVIFVIKNIFSLLRMNLYLNTKMIQLYYGDSFVEKNKFYFKTFNYYLRAQNLINIKEEDIIFKIEYNCRLITNDIKNILKIYQQINNNYYSDFIAIFNNISILSENNLKDYFYARLYGFNNNNNNINNNKNISNVKKRKINIIKGKNNNKSFNKNNDTDYNENNNNNLDNADVISVKSSKSSHYYGKIDRHNFKILKLINDYEKNKIEAPFIKTPNKKKYTLVLDLDETLINLEIKDINNNKCILHFRPKLFSFLNEIKPFYELISFTSASKEYAQPIINEIELKQKYFDYNFFREHSIIYGNDFVKDISRIGRDMKKIIIIDNMEENFRLNKKNGIKIAPFYGDENDKVLIELTKILILIFKQGYEDLTIALQNYSNEIKKKISLEN